MFTFKPELAGEDDDEADDMVYDGRSDSDVSVDLFSPNFLRCYGALYSNLNRFFPPCRMRKWMMWSRRPSMSRCSWKRKATPRMPVNSFSFKKISSKIFFCFFEKHFLYSNSDFLSLKKGFFVLFYCFLISKFFWRHYATWLEHRWRQQTVHGTPRWWTVLVWGRGECCSGGRRTHWRGFIWRWGWFGWW